MWNISSSGMAFTISCWNCCCHCCHCWAAKVIVIAAATAANFQNLRLIPIDQFQWDDVHDMLLPGTPVVVRVHKISEYPKYRWEMQNIVIMIMIILIIMTTYTTQPHHLDGHCFCASNQLLDSNLEEWSGTNSQFNTVRKWDLVHIYLVARLMLSNNMMYSNTRYV